MKSKLELTCTKRVNKSFLTLLMLIAITFSASGQIIKSVSFTNGAIGVQGSNSQQLNNLQSFQDLQISNAFFIQSSNNNQFIIQGNDIPGTLRLVSASNQFIDVQGAIVWREGNNPDYIGFIPATTPSFSTNLTSIGGPSYTITQNSNFALVFNNKSFTFINDGSLSGNAATSSVLGDLNNYLTAFTAARPSGPVTVSNQTTSSPNPTITGNVTLATGETFSIEFNGVVYTSGISFPTATTWSWTVPNSVTLAPGTYNIVATITNAGGYTLSDTSTDELIITADTDITVATVASIADLVYNGLGQTPSPVVKDGTTDLVADTDYTLSYVDNINVGTATVTVTGIGNYTGTKDVTFNITPAPLTITAEDKAKEFGAADPALTVSYTGFVNAEDATDLTGTLSISRVAGESVDTYAITASGLSSTNYALTYTAGTFTITSKSVTDTDITVASIADLVYNGLGQTPSPVVKDGATVLVKDTDYELSYAANTNVGTATLTVTGKGNYSANKAVTFNILKQAIAVTAQDDGKDYADADPVLSYTISPQLYGSDALTGSLSRTVGEAVGAYQINLGSLSAGAKYDLTLAGSAVFEIRRVDRDGDGVPDDVEDQEGTDPNAAGEYKDSDGDGVPDYVEGREGTDPTSTEEFTDSDMDGVSDYVELNVDGTDPQDQCDVNLSSQIDGSAGELAWRMADCDNDGISNYIELAEGDTDGDGIPNYLDADDDGDGLPTAEENQDPNGDGDPSDAFDSNNNGTPDYLETNAFAPKKPKGIDLEVYNAMSPNGDGLNDVLVIRNIERYPDNKLMLFNRRGQVLYEVIGYGQGDNFFDGREKQGTLLPAGMYFYVLRVETSSGLEEVKGQVYINY